MSWDNDVLKTNLNTILLWQNTLDDFAEFDNLKKERKQNAKPNYFLPSLGELQILIPFWLILYKNRKTKYSKKKKKNLMHCFLQKKVWKKTTLKTSIAHIMATKNIATILNSQGKSKIFENSGKLKNLIVNHWRASLREMIFSK